MAVEWYVLNDDDELGPFTVAQMRAQAATGRIVADTRVRRGRSGKWFAARNVTGLLPADGEAPDTESQGRGKAKPVVNRPSDSAAATTEDEGTYLVPVFNRKRRAIVFGVLVAFILVGQAPLYKQLFFDLTMGLIIGSFPLIAVKEKTIEQTLYILFYPAHKKVWKLRDFVGVEAEVEQRITDQFGCLVLIFFWMAILWRFFDFLMPWLGGVYKLYLREYTDERMVIWQGSSAADYEANLALFESRNLPIS